MKFKRKIKIQGNSHILVMPKDLIQWLNLKEDDEIYIEDDESESGVKRLIISISQTTNPSASDEDIKDIDADGQIL